MNNVRKNTARFASVATALIFGTVLILGIAGTAGTARAAGLVVCGGSSAELSSAQAVSTSTSANMQGNLNNFQTNSCQLSDIFREAALIANGLIGLAAAVALVLIVWAGFKLMLASGNESARKDALEHVTNAIIGLVIVLVAFLVINTIFSVLAVQIGGASTFPYNPFTS